MRISDWSSDVCSSDLPSVCCSRPVPQLVDFSVWPTMKGGTPKKRHISSTEKARLSSICASSGLIVSCCHCMSRSSNIGRPACNEPANFSRSEEHTSELQSLMRISYAVFCLKTKKHRTSPPTRTHIHRQHPTT